MTLTTDPTLAGLLRAICEAPADDLPCLLYADRAEELGQTERSEFIRLQIELVNHPPHHRAETGCPLRSRERELREHFGHWRLWTTGLPQPVGDLDYRQDRAIDAEFACFARFSRGFVSEIGTTLADWWGRECEHAGPFGWDGECLKCDSTGHIPGHGPQIVACQPIERVRLVDRVPTFNGVEGWVTERRFEPNWIPGDWWERTSDLYGRGITDPHERLSRVAVAWARWKAGLPQEMFG